MATAGKASMFTASNASRVELAAVQAGISDAFGVAADLGPQLLDLQRTLLDGIVRSQRVEAERLAALYDGGDSRIARATERAERLQAMAADVATHAGQVGRLVDAFRRPGTFSGYVTNADASPAVAYTVRIALATDQRRAARGSATTDDTGFFSIAVGAGQTDSDRAADGQGGQEGGQRMADRLMRLLADEHDPAPERAADGAAAAAAAADPQPAVRSEVQVVDPTGRVVFEDPMPPTFEALASEFRCYALTG